MNLYVSDPAEPFSQNHNDKLTNMVPLCGLAHNLYDEIQL